MFQSSGFDRYRLNYCPQILLTGLIEPCMHLSNFASHGMVLIRRPAPERNVTRGPYNADARSNWRTRPSRGSEGTVCVSDRLLTRLLLTMYPMTDTLSLLWLRASPSLFPDTLLTGLRGESLIVLIITLLIMSTLLPSTKLSSKFLNVHHASTVLCMF